MKLLILGKNGQLGYELDKVFSDIENVDFLSLSKRQCDITSIDDLKKVISNFKPQIIFNATAYTAVDKAESEPQLAKEINSQSLENIISVINSSYDKNTLPWIIHFSTDYVFDGSASTPYSEFHEVSPLGVYGQSKYDGEKILIENYPKYLIFRISWVYSYRANNFVKTMLKLADIKDELGVVNDQIGCPNYAPDIASAMIDVINTLSNNEKNVDKIKGIYHLSSQQQTSWYDFAKEIMLLANKSCKVNAISTAQFPTAAKRPAYSVLSTAKFRQAFHAQLPDWKDGLKRCLAEIHNENVG